VGFCDALGEARQVYLSSVDIRNYLRLVPVVL
jgi:hypothetical protein